MQTLPELKTVSGKVIIEAGHIYTSDEPSLENFIGAQWGNLVSKLLGVFGLKTENWLLIDNYNPKLNGEDPILDIPDYLSKLSEQGFLVDQVFYESDQVGKAQDILDYLLNNDKAHLSSNGIVKSTNGVDLYDNDKNKFSCALLDSCFYLQKLKHADACVTLLPVGHSIDQQKNVKKILKTLRADLSSIHPLFYEIGGNNTGSTAIVEPAMASLEYVANLANGLNLGDLGK